MFAINHAAAALIVKRGFPDVRLVPILISVQVMEVVWVALNYLGIERTTTEPVVRFVGDIHLEYMPFSHSIATMVGVATVVWFVLAVSGRSRLGLALAIGIVSHLVLDLVTHDRDITLAPIADSPEYGTRLYTSAPWAAFLLELSFGVLCWWIFRGGRALLAIIIAFNLANASLFFAAVPGPEQFLANRPAILTTVILAQIVVTVSLVGWAARKTVANGSPVTRQA